MTEAGEKALLPAGLRDVLAPEAAHEAAAVERLIAAFEAQGYERVKPPLMEFEEGLLSGAGAALASETFRLMDPVSHRMMALRADTTPQVARIAASRLAGAPRPLRLCYAGQVVRVHGGQLRPERQFGQVGAELIGSERPESDAEVVLLAAEALTALGISRAGEGGLSVDLNQPTLVTRLMAGLGLTDAERLALRAALDRKDAAAVEERAGAAGEPFLAMLSAAGPAERAMSVLQSLDLPGEAAAALSQLGRVIELIRAAAPDLELTVDPVEHRGFEYQTGVSFTLFARGVRGELGRGGRYRTEFPGAPSESATGFSLFMDSLLRALPAPKREQRLFLPPGTPAERAAALRAEGWVTLAGLDPETDSRSEALRLGCSHLLQDGTVEALPENSED